MPASAYDECRMHAISGEQQARLEPSARLTPPRGPLRASVAMRAKRGPWSMGAASPDSVDGSIASAPDRHAKTLARMRVALTAGNRLHFLRTKVHLPCNCGVATTLESRVQYFEKVAREWHEEKSRRKAGFSEFRKSLFLR